MVEITTWPFTRPKGVIFNEKNLSTEQHTKKKDAWISCPHGDPGRP